MDLEGEIHVRHALGEPFLGRVRYAHLSQAEVFHDLRDPRVAVTERNESSRVHLLRC